MLLIAAAAAGWLARAAAAPAPEVIPVRFAFSLGMPGVDRPYVTISPDGRRILQVVKDSAGVDRIVMRDLSSTALVPIQGTHGALDPAFSPDGAWISFTADGKLRKVPIGGGPAVDIADSATNGGGTWLPDGDIVFTREGAGLWRVGNSGGTPVQLTQLDTARREFAHWSPQALPSGNAVIYTSYATPISRSRIEAYDLGSGRTKVLVEGGVFGRYSQSGHLLYMRDEAIFAIPFDQSSLETRGTAVPVQEDVAWAANDGLGAFDVSPDGTLIYLSAAAWNVASRVVWTDRAGREEPAIPQVNAFAEPRLSPDGRWIAVTITLPRRDIWLYEISRRVLTPITRASASAFNPLWMPDSRSILYINEDPVYDVHRVPIDGSSASTPVVASPWDKAPSAVSADGRFLAYSQYRNVDRIYVTTIDGSGQPRQLTTSAAAQFAPTFSPDGRWLAYVERQGSSNVYLTAADGSGGRRRVSVDGGSAPQWTRGGREIVYRRGEALMAAPVDLTTGEVGQPVELFRKPLIGGLNGERTRPYDVSSDGNRFLLATPIQRPGAQPAVVVLNWFEALKTRTTR